MPILDFRFGLLRHLGFCSHLLLDVMIALKDSLGQ